MSEVARRPVVWTSFCPEMGLYYYRNELDESTDPIVEKFTHDELLLHVEGLCRAGKPELGQEIVVVCAWARAFAHMVVVLFTDGTFEARKPAPLPKEVMEDVQAMSSYVEQWKKSHADPTTVETAPAYRLSDRTPKEG